MLENVLVSPSSEVHLRFWKHKCTRNAKDACNDVHAQAWFIFSNALIEKSSFLSINESLDKCNQLQQHFGTTYIYIFYSLVCVQEITDSFIKFTFISSSCMKYTVMPTCKIKSQWFNKLNKAPYSHRPTTNMSQTINPPTSCLLTAHTSLLITIKRSGSPCIEPTPDQWVLTGQGFPFLFLSYITKGIAGMICFLSNLLRRIKTHQSWQPEEDIN